MVKEILLIISVILQIIAAIVAIGLTRRTKYNLSWMLFTVALTCMAFLRLGEYVQITDLKEWRLPSEFFIWTGIVTSLCFAVGRWTSIHRKDLVVWCQTECEVGILQI